MENETPEGGSEGGEVLVVASKLKNYIRSKSGMNTSAAVMSALSNRIRQLCDQAIENAKREGRKTVMDRDFG
jgi:histone H3/H4